MPVFRCKNIYTWGPSVLRPGLCLRPALGRNNFMASLDDSSIWGCRICAISTSGFKPTRQGLSAFTARKSGRRWMRGHYQKVCKKVAFAGALSKSWQSWGDSSSGWPQIRRSLCPLQTLRRHKTGLRIFRKPLNFFLLEISIHQLLKISWGPIWFSPKILLK